jgi:hypothetical protein
LLFYPCEPLRRDLLKLRVEDKSYGVRLVSPRDETGHGDTASAFSLALLLAHELSARAPVRAGAVEFSLPGETPLKRLEREFAERAASYNAERQECVREGMDYDNVGAQIELIRSMGGMNRLLF